MNSYGVVQFNKVELKNISIGRKSQKGDKRMTVSDDMNVERDLQIERDLFVDNDTHLKKNLIVGQNSNGNNTGAVTILGTLSVSGNTFLGDAVQTVTIRNDIIVEDTLSVAGSVTVASCQNEVPSNFMEFTRTRHATDDNTHVVIQNGDSLGSILFKGSDGTNWKKYVDIKTLATSVDSTEEGGKIEFNILSGGNSHSGNDSSINNASMNNLFSIGGENKSNGLNNSVVVNEAGINTDFRVESDLNEHMFYVDSISNRIAIGKSDPQFTLDIVGDINISNNIYQNSVEFKGGKVIRDGQNSITSVNFLEGSIGIGIESPQYELDVIGSIQASDSIITNNLQVEKLSVGPVIPGNHKFVIHSDLNTNNVNSEINNMHMSIENASNKSINIGILNNGKSIMQVIDENNMGNFEDLCLQPLGGNVAIGKSSAEVTLDIQGSDSIRLPVGNVSQRPTATGNEHLGYVRYNTETHQFEGFGAGYSWGSLGGVTDVDQDTFISAENSAGSDNDQLKFVIENNVKMIVDTSGNVGIGTQSPSELLHLKSTGATGLKIEADSDSVGQETPSLHLTQKNGTKSFKIGMASNHNTPFQGLWSDSAYLSASNNIHFATEDTNTRMTILKSGSVGIGTSGPDVSLDISATDAIRIPVGSTLQRPNSSLGFIRYNTNLSTFEGCGANNSWGSLGGVKDVDGDTYISAETSPGSDNDELIFFTASSEKMIIKSDGRIGIGKSDPDQLLDIDASIFVKDQLHLGDSNTDKILFTNQTNQSKIAHSSNMTLDYYAGLNTSASGNHRWFTSNGSGWSEKMRIQTNGNIGIGTPSPSELLHLKSMGAAGLKIEADSNSSGQETPSLHLTQKNGTQSFKIGMASNHNTPFQGLWSDSAYLSASNSIHFATEDTNTRMTILKSGSVGIGTSGPDVSLDISATDAIRIPVGTTLQRPNSSLGFIRYNTNLNTFEGCGVNNSWGSLGGVKDVDGDTYISAENNAGDDNDQLKFFTTDVQRMVIATNGKIGIGQSNPAHELDLTGDLNITGKTIIGGGYSGGGMTLKSDGDINMAGSLISDSDATITGTLIADKVLYNNVYSGEVDLPNASTYHGMFAHVHSTGKAYYSHAGAWRKLVDESTESTINSKLTLNKSTGVGLEVTSDATIGGNSTIGGNITVNGTSTLQQQLTLGSGYAGDGISLSVDGSISMKGNLIADGTITFPNEITVGAGYDEIGTNINSNGNISMGGSLVVDGSSTIHTNLSVAGLTKLSGDVAIGSGYGGTGSTLESNGDMNSSGNLVVDLDAIIGIDLSVGGTTNLQDIVLGTGYNGTGTNISSNGNVNMSGNLVADGNATVKTDLIVGNGYTGSGTTIDSTGSISMKGGLTADNNMVIKGTSNLQGNVTIGNGYSLTGTTFTSDGDVSVKGTITADTNLLITGNSTLIGITQIGNKIDFGTGYSVDGATIESNGDIKTKGNTIVGGTSQISGNLTLGNGYIDNGTTLTSNGDISMTGSLLTSGNATISGAVIADKILYNNVYSGEGDLPSASTYHGMFAHVHSTGRAYYSHAGNWRKLLDESSTANMTNTLTLSKASGTALDVTADVSIGGTLTSGKILYNNVYTNEGDLPSASTYHGMFAHVHSTGRAYFSHSGQWHKLVDESSTANMTNTLTLSKATGTALAVTSNVTIGGTLITDSSTTLKSVVTIGDGYSGTGLTLDTDGSLKMKGNLITDGQATLSGTTHIGTGYNGSGTTFTNTGNISMKGNMITDGNTTINGNNIILGNITIGNGHIGSGTTLTSDGDISMKGELSISGNSTLSGLTTIENNLIMGSGFAGDGTTFTASGDINMKGALLVSNNSTLVNDVTIGDGYSGSGITLSQNGNVSLKGEFIADGTTTLKGNTIIGSGFETGNGISLKDDGSISMRGSLLIDSSITGNLLNFSDNDGEKIVFMDDSNKSKIVHSANYSVDNYAGSSNLSNSGQYRWLVSDSTSGMGGDWVEKMALREINSKSYLTLGTETTIWAGTHNSSQLNNSGSLSLNAGFREPDGTEGTNMSSLKINGYLGEGEQTMFNFNSNGLVRMGLTNKGRLGIGTSTPTSVLDIMPELNQQNMIKLRTNNILSSGILFTDISASSVGPGLIYSRSPNSTYGENSLQILSQTQAEAINITADGKIGLGGISGAEKLEVTGNIKATGSLEGTSLNVNNGSIASGSITANGSVTINSSSPTALVVNSISPAAGENTTIEINRGETGGSNIIKSYFKGDENAAKWLGGQIIFQDERSHGLGGSWDTNMSFTTTHGGVISEKLRITKEGNIGIGITDPQKKLDVSGSANILNDIDVGSNINMGGNLNINQGKFNVTSSGNTTIDGTVHIAQKLTCDLASGTSLHVKGNIVIDGTLTSSNVSGDGTGEPANPSSLTVDTSALVTTSLSVGGKTTLSDDFEIESAPGVIKFGVQSSTGNVTSQGSLSVASTAEITDTLNLTKSSGTGLQVTSNAVVDGALTVNGDNLTVNGNLFVNGITTTINTSELSVEDKDIVLANVTSPSNVTADGAGFIIKGGDDGDKTFKYLVANTNFNSSEDLNVASGKSYSINNNQVLSSNSLGAGVTNSSLTSVGVLSTGSITSGFGNIDIGANEIKSAKSVIEDASYPILELTNTTYTQNSGLDTKKGAIKLFNKDSSRYTEIAATVLAGEDMPSLETYTSAEDVITDFSGVDVNDSYIKTHSAARRMVVKNDGNIILQGPDIITGTTLDGSGTRNYSVDVNNGTKIGIGINDPSVKLVVANPGSDVITGDTALSTGVATFIGSNADTDSILNIVSPNHTQRISIGYLGINKHMSSGAADNFSIKNSSPGRSLILSTTSTGNFNPEDRLTILENGNVGIGTDNPSARLHVYDNPTHTELFLGESAATNRCGIIKYIQGSSTVEGRMEFSNCGNNPVPLSILNSGDIGIGTITPSEKLHVNNGGISVTKGLTAISVDAYGSGVGPRIGFGTIANQDNILRIGAYDSQNNIDTTAASRDLHIRFGTANPVTSTIFKHDGKVGIGTESPSGLLHLKSLVDVVLRMEADSDNSGEGDNPLIHMSQDNNGVNLKIGLNGGTNGSGITGSLDNYGYINSATTVGTYGLQLATENNVAMTIDNLQNVGIGTPSPSSKLHIKGQRTAAEVTAEAAPITLLINDNTKDGTASYDGIVDSSGRLEFKGGLYSTGAIGSDDLGTAGGGAYLGGLNFYTKAHTTQTDENRNSDSVKDSTGQYGLWKVMQMTHSQIKAYRDININTDNTTGLSSLSFGANGSSHIISKNNDYMSLVVGFQEALSIQNDGSNNFDVGIGITSPSEKLDVNGAVRCVSSGITTGLISRASDVVTVIGSDGVGVNYGNIQVYNGSATSVTTSSPYNLRIQATGGETLIGNSNAKVSIINLKEPVNNSDATTKLYVDTVVAANAGGGNAGDASWNQVNNNYTMGSLGLGVAAPSQKLHVAGSIRVTNQLILEQQDEDKILLNGNTDHSKISISASGADVDYYAGVGNNTGAHRFLTKSNGSSFAEHMRINNVGNVGIGITNPSSKLHVDGTFKATGRSTLGSTSIEYQTVASSASIINQGSVAFNLDSDSSFTSWAGHGSNSDWYIRSGKAAGKVILQDTGGNVGIGDVNPTSKLHVDGSFKVTGAVHLLTTDLCLGPNAGTDDGRAMVAAGSTLVLNWTNDFSSGVQIGNAVHGETSNLNVTGGLNVGQGLATTNNTHDSSYARVYKDAHGYANFSNTRVPNPAVIAMGAEMYISTPTSDIFFNTGVSPNNSTKMFIANAGNVGIGTATPTELLDISKLNANNFIRIRSGNDSSNECGIKFTEYGDLYGFTNYYNSGTDKFHIASTDAQGSRTDRITIQPDGNVGIGTSSPSNKLHVAGTFRAEAGSSYNILQGHLMVADNLNDAHFRFGSATSSSGGVSPIAMLREGISNAGLTINYNGQFPAGTKINSALEVTGATTVSAGLDVSGDLTVDGDILLQGTKKFHIGSYDSNTPSPTTDDAIFMIAGDHNTDATTNTLFKLTGYNNNSTTQKVVLWKDENANTDYAFKPYNKSNLDGGVHYYRGSLSIGEDTSTDHKLNVNGFIRAKAVMREHNIDFSAMSNTKYYPIVIEGSSFKHLHEFYLIANGGQTSGNDDNPNDQLLYGKVVGGGHTDSKALVDVSTNIYDASENQILGIWRGTTDFTGIVIYVRGGFDSSGSLPGKYKLYTSSDNVTSYTTPATVPTTGSQSVFAIKNDTGADTGVTGEGTSANIGRLYDTKTNYNQKRIYLGANTSLAIDDTVLSSNGTPGQLILNSGNVGIGTTSPDKKLHVHTGGIEIEENSGDLATGPIPELVLRQSKYSYNHTVNRGVGNIKFVNSSTGNNTYASYASIEGIVRHERNNGIHCPDLAFFVKSAYNSTPREAITIVGGSASGNIEYGYVGIGTTSPSVKLVVANPGSDVITGDTALSTGVATFIGSNTDTDSILNIVSANHTQRISIGYLGINKHMSSGATDNFSIKNSSPGRSLILSTTSTGNVNPEDRLIILENGNVGIGTQSPLSKLHVKDNGKDVLQAYKDSVSGAGVLRIGQSSVGDHGAGEVGSRIIMSSIDGDDGGENCVIECREWGADEKQELLLFCGNDITGAPGPDRIRLKGAEILLDTYPNATSNRTTTSTRLKIDKDGNVGIGTTTPSVKLAVTGNDITGTDITTGVANFYGYTNSNYAAIHITEPSVSQWISIGYNEIRKSKNTSSGGNDDFIISNDTPAKAMIFRTSPEVNVSNSATWSEPTEKMRIVPNGNVGIGNTNPLRKLCLKYNGTETYNYGLEIENQSLSGDATNRHNHILFTDGNSTQASIGGYREAYSQHFGGGLSFMTGHNNNAAGLGYPTSDTMARAALTERMRITAAGNVGIGTTAPSEKLTVIGSVYIKDDDGATKDAGIQLIPHSVDGGGNSGGRIFFKESEDDSKWGFSLDYNGGTGGLTNLPVNTFGIIRHNGGTNGESGNVTLAINRESGNLGIGTTTPICKQSIKYTGTETYNYGLEIDNQSVSGDATNRHNHILFTDGNSTQASIGGYRAHHSLDFRGGLSFMTANDSNSAGFGNPSSTTMATNALTERMRIVPNGNIGIGTTSPADKLDVVGSVRTTSSGPTSGFIAKRSTVALVMGNSGGNGNTGSIQVWSDASESGIGGVYPYILNIQDNGGNLVLGKWNDSTYHTQVDNKFIANNDVGIGINSPMEKLHVDGTARTKDIIVTSFGEGSIEPHNLKPGTGAWSTAPALHIGKTNNHNQGGGEAAIELGVLNNGWGNHGGHLRYRLSTEGHQNNGLEFNIERVNCATGTFTGDPVNTKVMTIKQYNGTDVVGIGTSSPISKLHVVGTVRADYLIGELASSGQIGIDNNTSNVFNGFNIRFNRAFTNAIGADGNGGFADSIQMPPTWSDATGGGRNMICISKGNSIRMILKRANFNNPETPYITTDSGLNSQSWMEAVLKDSDGNCNINGDLTVDNLTVSGTTTTVNQANLSVTNQTITIGSGNTTDTHAAGGGITLKGATDKTLTWLSTHGWSSNQDFNLSDNKKYKINGQDVLQLSSDNNSTILPNGNVGIGTTSPSSKLHVKGTGSTEPLALFNTTSGDCSVRIEGAEGYLEIANTGASSTKSWGIGTNDYTSLHFKWKDNGSMNNGIEPLTLLTNGNVGIGTTAPSEKLHVSGGALRVSATYSCTLSGSDATGPILTFDDVSTPTQYMKIGAYSDGNNIDNDVNRDLHIRSGNAIRTTFKPNGNVGIGTTTPIQKLDFGNTGGNIRMGGIADIDSAATNSIGHMWSNDGGLYGGIQFISNGNDDELGFYTHQSGVSSGERMRIKGNGNVGIGTDAPQHKLHVKGTGSTEPLALFNTTSGDCSVRIEGAEGYLEIANTGASSTKSWGIGTNDYTSLHFKWKDNGSMNNGIEPLTLLTNGNVGIGTTTPIQKLDFGNTGGNIRMGGIADIDSAATNSIGHMWSNDGGLYGGIQFISNGNDDELGFYTHQSGVSFGEKMRIKGNGNVGIGNTSPSQKLDVSGNIAASGTVTQSDRRIKTDIEEVPDNLALSQVRDLECKYYHYKDPERRNDTKTIGFIAQEVAAVVPNAVSKATKFIPDIMETPTSISWTEISEDKWKAEITISKALELSTKIRLLCDITSEFSGMEVISEVISVSDKTITIELNKKYDSIFVYGTEIDDFHYIDKSQIFALHHSAIQQLDKNLAAEKTKTDSLETKVTELESENTQLKTQLASILARLDNLEGN